MLQSVARYLGSEGQEKSSANGRVHVCYSSILVHVELDLASHLCVGVYLQVLLFPGTVSIRFTTYRRWRKKIVTSAADSLVYE